MELKELKRETIYLIKQIYEKYPAGGALHIVLDDGNDENSSILWCLQNSIKEAVEDKELFEKCAKNLLKLGEKRQRGRCISQAFKEMREGYGT